MKFQVRLFRRRTSTATTANNNQQYIITRHNGTSMAGADVDDDLCNSHNNNLRSGRKPTTTTNKTRDRVQRYQRKASSTCSDLSLSSSFSSGDELLLVEQKQQQQQQQQVLGKEEEKEEPPIPMKSLLQQKASMSLTERWSDTNIQRVVQLWDLSGPDVIKLLQLKDRIADIAESWKNDPFEAIRFLKEKRNNVDRAEDLFRRVHQWRRDHNVDQVLETYQISPIFNFFPIAMLAGVDYDGDPIHLERPGASNCWSFYQRLGSDEIYKMALYMREMESRGDWQSLYEQEHGHPVKTFTIVIDLEGLSRNHLRAQLIPVLGRVLKMSQDQYPYFAKRVILLRAPRIFKVLWSLASHFLHDSVKKLLVFSTQSDYLDVIDQYMDRKVLPSCICPKEGQGKGALGFEHVIFEGGDLPPEHLTDEEINDLLLLLRRQRHHASSRDKKLEEDPAMEMEQVSPPPHQDDDDHDYQQPISSRNSSSSSRPRLPVQVSVKTLSKGFFVCDAPLRPAAVCVVRKT